jgi:hypothetical protein
VVEVKPGASIPSPEVRVVGTGVRARVFIELPGVSFLKAFLKAFAARRRLTESKALRVLLSNVVADIEIAKTNSSAAILSAKATKGRTSNKRKLIVKLRARARSVAVSRLPPGAYKFTYRISFPGLKGKKVSTKSSPAKFFKIPPRN